MGHHAAAPRPGEHDHHPAKAEKRGKDGGEGNRQTASTEQRRGGENRKTDAASAGVIVHPGRVPARGLAGRRPIIPCPDIAEMAAPGRAGQNQGGREQNDHEPAIATVQWSGGDQRRYRQMQGAGHEKPLKAEQPQGKLGKKTAEKRSQMVRRHLAEVSGWSILPATQAA